MIFFEYSLTLSFITYVLLILFYFITLLFFFFFFALYSFLGPAVQNWKAVREDSYVLFPILRKEIISFFATAAAKSLQLCPTLCDPIDGSPPGPCPCNSPDKNTGVGCHFLLQCMKLNRQSEVAQSCPTLCDPMDCSPPGSSIHGIFQARVLEWDATAFSTAALQINSSVPSF